MSWFVDADALESIAIGAGVLGTGGGGNPYYGKLHARRLIDDGARVEIVSPDDVPDDAVVASVGSMGSPTIGIERIPRGDESLIALRALERHVGKPAEYLIPGEIGGVNSTRPMVVSALTGLPVIDGDGMGRAFPELQMDTFSIYGVSIAPATLADPRHNTVVFPTIEDPHTLERYARAVTIQMGGSAGYAFPIMSAAEMRRTVIPNTISLARSIGDVVRQARARHDDPAAAITTLGDGVVLFTGKIMDIERRLVGGFARGAVAIDGLGTHASERMRIEFQNEYLVAYRDDTPVAIVPDLICIVDLESAEPITTEILRYGLRIAVLGMPAPLKLKTPEALAVVGPMAFGYDLPFSGLPGRYGGDVAFEAESPAP